MWTTIHKAFSDCLERIKGGEAVNSCLAGYPQQRRQIAPLLYTALSISAVPKVVPSEDFRRQSTNRLLARLLAESRPEKSHPAKRTFDGLATIWRVLEAAFTGPARVTVPIALGLIIALQCFLIFGTFNFMSRPATGALASQGTLSILKGSIQLQVPGSTAWEEAKDGVTVLAGSRVKTDQNAQAMLTFFNGTAVTLEPGTDLVVERAEGSDKQPTVIVLKQWVGKTLSRVTKLADAAAHYEIQTPSASALVRGTLFVTEVDEKGATRVQTIEGLVGVSGQGVEVGVAAGQQTTVEPGGSPSKPAPISQGERSSGQSAGGAPVPGTDSASTGGSSSAGQSGVGTPVPGTGSASTGGSAQTAAQNVAGASAQELGAGTIVNQAGERPADKVVAKGPSAEKAPPVESTGQNIKTENSRQQGKEGLPAPTTDNKDQPRLDQGLSWQNQYDKWTMAFFTGVIIFYFSIVALILWRRRR